MGAMYLEDLVGTLTGAGNKIALNNILNDKDVQLRLSQMNFDADVFQSCSPRSNGSMPALEKEVIDLTQDVGKGKGKDEDVVEDNKDEDVEMEDVPQAHHGAWTGTVTTSKTNCPVSQNCKGKIYTKDHQT